MMFIEVDAPTLDRCCAVNQWHANFLSQRLQADFITPGAIKKKNIQNHPTVVSHKMDITFNKPKQLITLFAEIIRVHSNMCIF